MSPRSLLRQCTAMLGEPPIAYLLRIRLDKAAELLTTSALAITEIAECVGFRDSNYFTRQFHRRFGVPPIVYRRQEPR
ncbi:MAG TPA: helix-turn-helix transcriptional regulator [Armatimonadota bacterium]|jgi:AraC-like DNA-binding protein